MGPGFFILCKFMMPTLASISNLHIISKEEMDMERYFENGATVLVTTKEDAMVRIAKSHTGLTEGPHGGWYVRTNNTYLGTYATKEEAEYVRCKSLKHVKKGDFDEWAKQYRAKYVK